MGDIIIAVSLTLYVVACIHFGIDNHRRKNKRLTEADIAKLEQMIKGYNEITIK